MEDTKSPSQKDTLIKLTNGQNGINTLDDKSHGATAEAKYFPVELVETIFYGFGNTTCRISIV